MNTRAEHAIGTMLLLMPMMAAAQGIFCEPLGNVVIFSNYDGGALTIDVDQNIPDLRIGVVSYEFSRITVSGPYASNVTALWYVGYNADNDHCSLGGTTLSTTITGAPAGTDSIMLYPPATWPSTNGYGNIICNYSCDVTTYQGGCNTADQIAHYFLTQWGGTLLFHFTQYGCWGNGYSISGGGNCCENPLATAVDEEMEPGPGAQVMIVGETLAVDFAGPYEVIDATGRSVLRSAANGPVALPALPDGSYVVRSLTSQASAQFAIAR